MRPLWPIFTLALVLGNSHAAETNRPATKPINLLFIMTDQQRWDAMSCAGNTVLKTPNLDELARQGARFTSFYSACPVCVPARTAIFTGHSIESNHVLSNADAERTDAPPFPSFDQILLRHGYRGEYHGKFHSPYQLALDYTQPVRWLNGKKAPPGSKSEISESEAFFKFVQQNAPPTPAKPGLLASRHGNYTPIPLDENYGKTPVGKPSQAGMYGRLEVPAGVSHTAFTAKEGMVALDRLKGSPFTLTISLDPPHPPMMVAEPYYSLYPSDRIPVPASINDPRTNSPYRPNKREDSGAYRNPTNIRQMTSIYYGMVAEVDEWVGKILRRLDELGLAENTLVIFTSDHGEMLGDHGMHSKNVFYEGSAHVPLLLCLPGMIPAGTVIQTPASHLDLFPTILDYCGQAGHASEGDSLRPFIEGKESGTGRVAVSEWNSQTVPGFMIFDGRWKFMCGQTADAPSLDALYDLKNDPQELNNVIGRNPDREKHRAEATRMKGMLVEWLARVKSPHLESVKARPLFVQIRADAPRT
ncbi:MAG: sulfatase-like hydrolase/transferase [Verrucomicrobia bacterium]|nr:sulfatase-like hydrolase/transferase [Verrucomicrobiota bacterium]